MEISNPQYKDLHFESKEEFNKWLKETACYGIIFEDEGQDFTEWYLDEYGEVLDSDLQAFVWNGKMVDVKNMYKGGYLPLQSGGYITHKVVEIKKLKKSVEEVITK